MIVKTGRFGQLTISDSDFITIPQGILGFPQYTKYCLVDAADDTLILWLQSVENPDIAFPVLEPKIYKPEYTARLSAAELRELKMDSVNGAAVFSILTIPEDVMQMSANLKAPLVINLKAQVGKQVVLQENEYSIKHLMFKELRAHLITIGSQQRVQQSANEVGAVTISGLPVSQTVRSLI